MFRVARRPDPWAWPDWAYANPDDGTFDNRWDDPQGSYRVLYASSQRAGAFVETLARFRPDLELLADLDEIESSPGDDPIPAGVVPSSWADARIIGSGFLKGEFADVAHTKSLQHLRRALAQLLRERGIDDLDAGTVRTTDRSLTQLMSRMIYEVSVDGHRAYAGVAYQSRLGDQYENWGLFDIDVEGVASPLTVMERADISLDDPAMAEAMEYLGLKHEKIPVEAEAAE